MATTKKTAKSLKRGDTVVIKDRLWAIVDGNGRFAWAPPEVPVFIRRDDAKNCLQEAREGNFINVENWKVIRLNDVTGVVV